VTADAFIGVRPGSARVKIVHMAMIRFIRDQPSTVDRSGLTGDPDIPDPPPEERLRGVRARLAVAGPVIVGTVRRVPRMTRLVWDASPLMTVGLGCVTVVSGLMPVAQAWTSRLLINAIVSGIRNHAAPIAISLPWGGYAPPLSVTRALIALAAVQFGLYLVSAVTTEISSVAQQCLQERISQVVQLQVMEKACQLDMAFFEDSRSYDLLRQAQQEAANRPLQMVNGALGLLRAAITLTSMLAVLIGLNPWLALVVLLAAIPEFISDARFSRRGFFLSMRAAPIRRRMQYLATLVTTDTAAKEVKLFGLGGFFTARFRLLGQVYYARVRRLAMRRSLVSGSLGMLGPLVGSLTYLYIALQAVAGRLTLGDLTLYTQATNSVQSGIQQVFSSFSTLYENALYMDNLDELLATVPVVVAPASPVPLPSPVRGHIVFEHVTFHYPGTGIRVLDDVSVEIRPGEMVALVGRNGAGKSTFVKLLCRLYDPDEGRILLDGIDITTVDPAELRSAIGGMYQDFVNYQATAGENIGLGEVARIEDAPAVAASARSAGAAALIEGLPRGYDTALGKWFGKGTQLSGGEWQKVALARSFMRTAPILVLDEPTSALDAQAEYELFERLHALAEGRTAVFISHRFSTVRKADRIFLFHEGRLAEEGTHAELMRLEGRYAELFTLQASAYID
jgi:ATP-binding cassette, subfamily B, bacterial